MLTSPIWYPCLLVTDTTPGAEEVAFSVFPNPMTGTTMMSYYLPAASAVRAEVVDALGRRVAALATWEAQGAGPHTLAVPALVPGRYTVRLTHAGGPAYRKLVVE